MDQALSKEQSIAIIQQMIGQAKTNLTDNGNRWLVWGTLLFLTSVSTYIFIDSGAENIFLAWNVFGGLTVILLTYDIIKPRKKLARTYVGDLLKLVDIGFVCCIFTVIFSINVAVNASSGFGFFLMIFAFLMLIKGGAIQSRSLLIGAVVNWAGSIAIFLTKEFKYDMLIMAAAVLIGYIIPGIMLRAQYRKINNIQKPSSGS
jgi:hypothetical protein